MPQAKISSADFQVQTIMVALTICLPLLLLGIFINVTVAIRNIVVNGTSWTNSSTGEAVVLTGANIVMKGFPWLPEVSGSAICDSTEETVSVALCYLAHLHSVWFYLSSHPYPPTPSGFQHKLPNLQRV